MLITSINNEKIKEVMKLKDKKHRDLTNKFLVEGKDLIDEAYKNGLLKQVYLLMDTDIIYNDVPCCYVSLEVMKKLSDMESICECVGVCIKKEEKELGNKLIILDKLQDPGNLGTIIRSAVAFGFDTVVLGKGSVDLYNPKVIRSTKGMLFNINIISRDLEEFIVSLDGYVVYGTDVVNGIDIREENIPSKLAIVIGNEGQGISDNIKELCDKNLYISMDEKCESLNAGVSASILMYEVMKK